MAIGSSSIGSEAIGGLVKPVTYGVRTLASEIVGLASTMNQGDGAWCRLYDIVVDTTTTLYKTDYPKSLTYNGTTYDPYPIKIDGIPYTAKPENKTFTVNVANIDKTIATYLEQDKLLGNDVTISWVFVRKDTEDIVMGFQDKWQILGAEISEESAFASFECGRQNLFKEKLPHERWIDFRCVHIYKAVGTCDYGNEEFSGSSRLNLKTGGNGAKIQGWRVINSAQASVIDIDTTNSDQLTIQVDSGVNAAWSTASKNGPYIYRKFRTDDASIFSPDFDIQCSFETGFGGQIDEVTEAQGILITTDLDAPTNWIFLQRVILSGSTISIAGYVNISDIEATIFTTVTSSDAILRVTKIGQSFACYSKSGENNAWTSLGSVNHSAMNNVILRCGIAVETNSAARSSHFITRVKYWKLNSGGYLTCDRALASCRVRENTRRFGGAPGIIHGPLIL